LSGILKCDVCGSSLIIGGGTLRYLCAGHQDGGNHVCDNSVTVQKIVAEALLIKPIISELLSPAAVTEFGKELRRLEREHRERPALSQPSAAVQKLDARLEQLEGMRIEGILSNDEHATLAARAMSERRSLMEHSGMLPDSREALKVARMLPDAAAALRGALADAAGTLADPRCIREARTMVSEFLGGTVRVRPSIDRTHLIASVRMTPFPLLRAAGMGAAVGKVVAGVGFEPTTFGL
jgi:hypothetical protein